MQKQYTPIVSIISRSHDNKLILSAPATASPRAVLDFIRLFVSSFVSVRTHSGCSVSPVINQKGACNQGGKFFVFIASDRGHSAPSVTTVIVLFLYLR